MARVEGTRIAYEVVINCSNLFWRFGLNRGIILKFALQKWVVKVWTEFMWLRRGTSGGRL